MKTVSTIIKTSLIALALLSFPFDIAAQGEKLFEGYIITNDGDTIRGHVKMSSPVFNEIKVHLLHPTRGWLKFDSKEVKGYRFNITLKNGETKLVEYDRFKMRKAPVSFSSREALLYKNVSGPLDMYFYFVETPMNLEKPVEQMIFVKNEDGTLEEISKTNYKEFVERLANEFSDLGGEAEKRYSVKQLEKLITRYNDYKTNHRAVEEIATLK